MDIDRLWYDSLRARADSVEDMAFNFKPNWVNNVTRLNAQNFNNIFYKSLKDNIKNAVNKAYSETNEGLLNMITLLPGYKPSNTSTSEIHNTEIPTGTEHTNHASGEYQAAFGKHNVTSKDAEGQFLTGLYSSVDENILFAIGNGTKESRSNALSVTKSGNLTISGTFATTNITTNYITLENAITDSSNDTYAATKKYVFDKVKQETERAIEVENSIKSLASSAFHFKGTKDSYEELLQTEANEGDVYQVGDKEYAYNGSTWVELGFNVDLSNYATIDYVTTSLNDKQDNLISGTNIKTINGTSLLGSGNIVISGGGSTGIVDQTFSPSSENAQSGTAVNQAVYNKVPQIEGEPQLLGAPLVMILKANASTYATDPNIMYTASDYDYISVTPDVDPLMVSSFGGTIPKRLNNGNLTTGTPTTNLTDCINVDTLDRRLSKIQTATTGAGETLQKWYYTTSDLVDNGNTLTVVDTWCKIILSLTELNYSKVGSMYVGTAQIALPILATEIMSVETNVEGTLNQISQARPVVNTENKYSHLIVKIFTPDEASTQEESLGVYIKVKYIK